MNVLVLNCGSSTLKFQLIETDQNRIDHDSDVTLAKGVCERIGSQALITLQHGKKIIKKSMPLRDHTAAINFVINWLIQGEDGPIVNSIKDIHAVGHRVVHGGEKMSSSSLITPDVIRTIEDCIELAPLHNPANLAGIKSVSAIFGNIPQVVVFDTAFHNTMPETAYLYALPYQYYRRHKIRRYGFHGTSHRYVAYRFRKIEKIERSHVNIITLHLGNGCSACLIKGGDSYDTSMGLTPTEGLVMGTRSGNIDPAIVEFIMAKEGFSVHETISLLNKQSGLLGISGLTHDMRELLEEEKENKDRRASLAISIFVKRIREYLGSYLFNAPEVTSIVLTGGIGENAAVIRERIFTNLGTFGLELDNKKNTAMTGGQEGLISTAKSPRSIYVIPTDEELLIARDTYRIVSR